MDGDPSTVREAFGPRWLLPLLAVITLELTPDDEVAAYDHIVVDEAQTSPRWNGSSLKR